MPLGPYTALNCATAFADGSAILANANPLPFRGFDSVGAVSADIFPPEDEIVILLGSLTSICMPSPRVSVLDNIALPASLVVIILFEPYTSGVSLKSLNLIVPPDPNIA